MADETKPDEPRHYVLEVQSATIATRPKAEETAKEKENDDGESSS